MNVLRKLEFPDNKFDLYFLGYDQPGALYHGRPAAGREGVIEVRPDWILLNSHHVSTLM